MADGKRKPSGLADNPLTTDELLRERFYGAPRRAKPPAQPVEGPEPVERRPHRSERTERPTHYKVISISLYTEDLRRLDEMVAELKRRGHTKANKSQIIRHALDQLDLDTVPRGP